MRSIRWLVGTVAGLGAIAVTAPAMADEFKLRYPVIEYRELEVEHNGAVTFDRRNSGKNNGQTYTNEIEYAFIPQWKVGLEVAALEASPGRNLRWQASALENYVQLTPQGKYWADVAVFVELERPTRSKAAPSITFGPLIQKEVPNVFGVDTLHTANLLFTKEVGHLADPATPMLAAWQSRLRLHPLFEPGFEYYGGIEDIGNAGSLSDQQHRIGPMLAGLYAFPPYGKLKYEAGYLFGLTAAAEKGVVRWRLEYEIAF